jgi:hypothetical protein
MALDPQAALTFDADSIMIEDTTGDYHAVNNPGGYGTPNPAFSDLTHHVLLRKKNVNNVDDEVIEVDAYNSATDTEFEAERSEDGWYEVTMLHVRKWSAGSLAADTVRSHNGVLYVSNATTGEEPGTGNDWDEVEDLADIEENNTVFRGIDGRTTAYNADLYWSKQIAANSRRGKCGICEDDRQKERLDRIYAHIQAVQVADGFGNNSSGAWNVLSLIQLGAVSES